MASHLQTSGLFPLRFQRRETQIMAVKEVPYLRGVMQEAASPSASHRSSETENGQVYIEAKIHTSG